MMIYNWFLENTNSNQNLLNANKKGRKYNFKTESLAEFLLLVLSNGDLVLSHKAKEIMVFKIY